MAGVFITFEGGEGCGKTTLISGIYNELVDRGLSILSVREPGGTHLGEEIRQMLLNRPQNIVSMAELCLFLAARSQHVEEIIVPAIRGNKVVLCDRFNDSTVAYQGFGRHLGPKKVAEFCHFITGGVEPQLTIYLDIAPEDAFKRIQQKAHDRIESEAVEFHKRVRDAYYALAEQEPNRIRIIDAMQSPEDVLSSALVYIDEVLLLYGME